MDIKDAALVAAGALLGPAGKEAAEVLRLAVRNRLLPLQQHLAKPTSVESFIDEEVTPRLAAVPPERLQDPAPHVVVPALMAVAYTTAGELRAMFAALLAKSMDSATAGDVHPSFVEVIKQLTPDEARVLSGLRDDATFFDIPAMEIPFDSRMVRFSGAAGLSNLFDRAETNEQRERAQVTIDNLVRQNFASFDDERGGFSKLYTVDSSTKIAAIPHLSTMEREALEEIVAADLTVHATERRLSLTSYGRRFCACCIDEPPPTASKTSTIASAPTTTALPTPAAHPS